MICLPIAIGGLVLFIYGKKRKKLIDNFSQYIQYMEAQEVVSINELSTEMGRSEEVILKELGELLEKQYFVNMIIDYSSNEIKMLAKNGEEKKHTESESVIKDEDSVDIDSENVKQEAEDNKERSKSELVKKLGKFVSEYKNFKKLTLVNKIMHIVMPILLLILIINVISGDNERIIKTNASSTGAVYNLDYEEGKEIVEKAIKECCGVKISLDDDFKLNQDGSNGIQSHIYVANDESILGFPLGIEISVVDEYVQAFVFKTDTSGGNFDGLGIIQELYCEVANEVTGDNIRLEDIKEIVKNEENNADRYRNDSIHLICRNRDTFVFYYMFYACSKEFYLERSE